MQTAPQFSWDSSIGKFVGPAQKSNLEKAVSEAARVEEEKLVGDVKVHHSESVSMAIYIIHRPPPPPPRPS